MGETAGIRPITDSTRITRRHALLGGLSLLTLSGCSSFDFDFPRLPIGGPAPPAAAGETLGTGPVRVALLLPLSGDASLTNVATSMRNGAALAMDFIASNGSMQDNITLTIKDTGPTAQGAASAAASVSSPRSVMSRRLPIGVATT